MGLFNRLVDSDSIPVDTKAIEIPSPLSGRVVPLNNVQHAIFTERMFGEGVAIQPSGYQVIAPFNGTMLHFPELGNQMRLKANNGLIIQIQLGIDSHVMLAEGFKRKVLKAEKFNRGQVLAEFSLPKMKQQLSSVLCPVTVINSEKIKALQAHYFQVIAGQDTVFTVYL